jgi:ADP-ribosylglycohydrolase
MIGAIAGDIAGSTFEGKAPPLPGFELFLPGSRFTDDTVLSVAVAAAARTGAGYRDALLEWGRRYPRAGYGGMFLRWLEADDPRPYQSFGNGSAMRVAPLGWAHDALDDVLREAQRSAEVTHDHAEGIRGAQAVAGAVWLARRGGTKAELAGFVSGRFGYDLSPRLAELARTWTFDVTCQRTVPAALAAFLEAPDFAGTLRNAIGLGGDTDTLACIAGAIAEAHYGGVPAAIQALVWPRLDAALQAEVREFCARFGVPVHA